MTLEWEVCDTPLAWPSNELHTRALLPDGASFLAIMQEIDGSLYLLLAQAGRSPKIILWDGNRKVRTVAEGKQLADRWFVDHYPLHALARLSEGDR